MTATLERTPIRLEQTNLLLSEGVASDPASVRVCRRFCDKVEVAESGCWLWTANTVYGYGQLYYHGRPQRAHRVSWQLFRGPIPDGMFVLHTCDNPGCVNPDHLFLGDQYDNHQDMTRKGRARVGMGSRHANAKLTEPRVAAIRLLVADGVSVSAIARCLGVSIQTISRIRDDQSWRHVA